MMLRTLSERTTNLVNIHGIAPSVAGSRTFIFADVFEGKCQARVFTLNNANFAKGPLAHDSQKPEMIEIDWRTE